MTVAIYAVLTVLVVFALLAATEVASGPSRKRADRIRARSGHVADDPFCREYSGDFAGVDLAARCELCNPTDEQASHARTKRR